MSGLTDLLHEWAAKGSEIVDEYLDLTSEFFAGKTTD